MLEEVLLYSQIRRHEGLRVPVALGEDAETVGQEN